jgi:hypothetical protein
MTKEEQKKAIDAFANVRIAELKNNWAQNYCARKINQGIVSTASLDQKKKDVAKKEVEACNLNLKVAEQEIENFKWILKENK